MSKETNRPIIGKIKRFIGRFLETTKNNSKKKIVGAAAIATAGLTAIGVGEAINESPTINFSQALSIGETSESLGLNDGIISRMKAYENVLNNNDISNKSIIELFSNIHKLAKDIFKSKIANAMGIDTESVDFGIKKIGDNNVEYVKTFDNHIYTEYKNNPMFSSSDFNGISDEIAKQIVVIEELNKLEEKVTMDNFNRENIINDMKHYLEEISKMAAIKIEHGNECNIISTSIKVSDLPELAKKREEFKTSPELYSINSKEVVDNGDKVNNGDKANNGDIVKFRYDDDGR